MANIALQVAAFWTVSWPQRAGEVEESDEPTSASHCTSGCAVRPVALAMLDQPTVCPAWPLAGQQIRARRVAARYREGTAPNSPRSLGAIHLPGKASLVAFYAPRFFRLR